MQRETEIGRALASVRKHLGRLLNIFRCGKVGAAPPPPSFATARVRHTRRRRHAPHGSAKKKKKGGRDGKDRGKRSGRGASHRGADHSRGVGGGSSLENLIDSGNEHLAMDRVREGLADLRRACALVPDSADAWDAYGIALAEFGPNPDDAVKVLKRAAQLSPDLGYEKFMYLGQLLDDGEAAATCTRRGLALIEYQAAHGDEDASERMCGACCALAEQLMAIAEDVDDVAENATHCSTGGGGGSRVGRAVAGAGVAPGAAGPERRGAGGAPAVHGHLARVRKRSQLAMMTTQLAHDEDRRRSLKGSTT